MAVADTSGNDIIAAGLEHFHLVCRGELTGEDGFHGRPIVVGQYAWIGDHWETIDARALPRPEGEDTVLTYDHIQSDVLARTSSGTLTIAWDAAGLDVTADMARTTRGMDTRELLRRGDVTTMSFAMRRGTVLDEWTLAPDGLALRTIVGFQLVDVSIVPRAAYLGTSAELRSVTFQEPTAAPTRSRREQLLRARAAVL